VIYYVSTLNRASSTYLYIYGAHFDPVGKGLPLEPETNGSPPGAYTGSDTIFADNDYPSLGIFDFNQGWQAGGFYIGVGYTVTVDGHTFSGWDTIGVLGLTWSDTQITLTGLGNRLPAADYHIHNEDKLLGVVFTPAVPNWNDGPTPPTNYVYAVTTYTGSSF
jgi:hypothetical protein